jgi:hypothetical protein
MTHFELAVKFQPPDPSIKAGYCIPGFWSFGRFV